MVTLGIYIEATTIAASRSHIMTSASKPARRPMKICMGGLLASLASIVLGLILKSDQECGAACSLALVVAYAGGAVFVVGFIWLMVILVEDRGL